MPFTISDSRSQVLEHLDNESGSRYAKPDATGALDYTKVDRALRLSLTKCLDDYAKSGGDKFDEEVSVPSDATGTIDMSTYQVLAIRGVLLEPSTGTLYPVEEGDRLQRGVADLSIRNYRVVLVRQFPIAATPTGTDLLVGATAGAARSWEAFDEWVCLRAARTLGVKDLEGARMEQLSEEVADAAKSVLEQQRNPRVLPWPSPSRSLWYRSLRWTWMPRALTLNFFFDRRSS